MNHLNALAPMPAHTPCAPSTRDFSQDIRCWVNSPDPNSTIKPYTVLFTRAQVRNRSWMNAKIDAYAAKGLILKVKGYKVRHIEVKQPDPEPEPEPAKAAPAPKTTGHAILCVTTGQRFPSIRAAAEDLNISESTVRKSLKQAKAIMGFLFAKLTATQIDSEPEQRKKGRTDQSRPIVCLNTGERFDSILSAAAHFSLHKDTVRKCAQLKRTTNNGLVFRYADKANAQLEITLT